MLPVDYVALELRTDKGFAALREIRGQEEWLVNGTDTLVAIHLVDCLLVDIPSVHCKPGSAAALTAAERDRLLAAVYCRLYGRRVVATLTCQACHQPFDLDFDFGDLLEAGRVDKLPFGLTSDGEIYELPGGARFRLPTGEDELAIAPLSPEQAEEVLLKRCMVDGAPESVQGIQEAMEALAPLLDSDLDCQCTECSQLQSVHFDLQRYLLRAIQSEQPRLAREVHLLAGAYGWRLAEILALPRSQRRMYVSFVEGTMS
jgi:hypothetical protein